MDRPGRRRTLVVVVVAGLVLAALGAAYILLTMPPGGVLGGLPGEPITGSTGSPTQSPTTGLKPAIHGLLELQGAPPGAYRPVLAGYDVQGANGYGGVSWAELQPTAGGAIATDNPIDKAIADVRAWNAGHPGSREVLKVRVQAGVHSPSWAMNLGGAPVAVHDPNFNVGGQCPRFWTPAFATAFYDFEAKLVARYDSVPEVAEVVIARNMTIYNEPELRQIQDPNTVSNLLAAGYSTALDEQNQLADMDKLAMWKHTRVGFTFNPYQTLGPSGNDLGFTLRLMDHGRQVLGPQLVLENDSLRTSFFAGNGLYPQMYAHMRELGAPLGFQTAVLKKVGDLSQTIMSARDLGATNIELPPGYRTVLAPENLTTLATALPKLHKAG